MGGRREGCCRGLRKLTPTRRLLKWPRGSAQTQRGVGHQGQPAHKAGACSWARRNHGTSATLARKGWKRRRAGSTSAAEPACAAPFHGHHTAPHHPQLHNTTCALQCCAVLTASTHRHAGSQHRQQSPPCQPAHKARKQASKRGALTNETCTECALGAQGAME